MTTKSIPKDDPARKPGDRGDARREAIWKRAYEARTKDDLRELYADWAETYDEDHDAIGFEGHRMAAEVLARHVTRQDVCRVLDAGAGTGAAGTELARLGFKNLVALDLSPDMLERAAAKDVYLETHVADLAVPVDHYRDATFDAAILVGVFSYGQAPAEALDEILRLVRPGGVVVFTVRTDFWDSDAMGVRSRAEWLEREGAWSLLERTDPAPYLPKKDPDAKFRVWCYRVTEGREPEVEEGFEEAVRRAFTMKGPVKVVDHAWIWDSTASRLYNRYTQSDGYYLTECEEEILRDRATEIWSGQPVIVELGCGSARKIKHVLRVATADAREKPIRYIPIDVSQGAVDATTDDVTAEFGDRLEVEPRQGLFADVLHELPVGEPKLVFFFGSSIGNLGSIPETIGFLRSLGDQLRTGDRFVVGIDLHKDAEVLEDAYNREESCLSFFVHMLRRVNEALGADFDPRAFELASTYEQEPEHEGIRTHRVNLRIRPTEEQRTYVQRLDLEVVLEPSHAVQVGISRKFTPKDVERLGELAGLRLERQWFDRRNWFSLNEFVIAR